MVAWSKRKVRVAETPRARGNTPEMRWEGEWGFGFSLNTKGKHWRV